jgi:hypothetical protein
MLEVHRRTYCGNPESEVRHLYSLLKIFREGTHILFINKKVLQIEIFYTYHFNLRYEDSLMYTEKINILQLTR